MGNRKIAATPLSWVSSEGQMERAHTRALRQNGQKLECFLTYVRQTRGGSRISCMQKKELISHLRSLGECDDRLIRTWRSPRCPSRCPPTGHNDSLWGHPDVWAFTWRHTKHVNTPNHFDSPDCVYISFNPFKVERPVELQELVWEHFKRKLLKVVAFRSSWTSISAASSAPSESVCQTVTCAVNLNKISRRSVPEPNSMYLNSLSLINKVSMARASAALSTWASLWEHKDTKVVGYQCQWMTPPFPSHHHSPIEGSVRFMLKHLIEIFQCFYLSCCLKVTHEEPHSHFFSTWQCPFDKKKFSQLTNQLTDSHLGIRKPACHSGIGKDFCKTISIPLSFQLVMSFDCLTLSPPACTFERVLVTWRRVHQHEFGSILQQDLVVLSHRLFQKVGDELVLHKPWAGDQDALYHWQRTKKRSCSKPCW